MRGTIILICFLVYTLLLFGIGWVTSRRANNASYFTGNRQSPWYVVAYGMIGASLSGVTFISVPGDVANRNFSYMMIVVGYLLGYFTIVKILLPLYFRMNLTSIYTYLGERFGRASHKTGGAFFIVSKLIGAAFRMFLVINVLHVFVFDEWHIPFWVTAMAFMVLINLYTYKGGIKTIVWTDTLQTTFMLAAVVICFMLIKNELAIDMRELVSRIVNSTHSQVVYMGWRHPYFFLKQLFSGAFIAIVMTGLDQDMMQKNLSCRNLKEAQKNMLYMSSALVPVNLLFLLLGGALLLLASSNGIAVPASTDELFPLIALKYLPPFAGVVFTIGIIAAAYSSADGALTALTTSFTLDFLQIEKNDRLSDASKKHIRHLVHVSFAVLIIAVIVLFKLINNDSVIAKLLELAGYTYGPLLGLFAFGILTRHHVRDRLVLVVCLASPLLCYVLKENAVEWFNGYRMGFELLIYNGMITFAGLWCIKIKNKVK